MPYWLGAGLWLATRFTVGAFGFFCVAGGWVLGYQHRELLELGRRYGRLLMWRQMHRWRPLARLAGAYRGLWFGSLLLGDWGREPVARVNARAVGR